MDFIINGITRKNPCISLFDLAINLDRNRLDSLALFIWRRTVYNADILAFLKLRQLTDISCIRCFDTIFDIDDATRHSLFTGLAYRFADRDNTVRSIRLQDIPLRHLATIAERCGVADAIGNTCIVAKRHVLAITSICMHANRDAVIAGICAFTYGQCIVLCLCIRANRYRIITFCQSSNTSGQSIPALCTIIVIVVFGSISRVDAVKMRLSRFQLGHVDGIRIFFTSCDVGNLTGKIFVTNRNSGSFRLPNTSRIFTVVNVSRIVTDYILITRGY